MKPSGSVTCSALAPSTPSLVHTAISIDQTHLRPLPDPAIRLCDISILQRLEQPLVTVLDPHAGGPLTVVECSKESDRLHRDPGETRLPSSSLGELSL